ncbi:hypothetical protein QP157_20640 [Sphingomonas sp. LR61]|uniref:hypothetical protein n=1 Tax=Sphingomonas sp. LR61 TaxID=3050234 RepID=UPI002FE23484
MTLVLTEEGGLPEAASGVIDPDATHEPAEVDQRRQTLVDLRDLLSAPGDGSGDLARGVGTWLHQITDRLL